MPALIDTASEPGSWADALRHSVNIHVSEHEPRVAAGDCRNGGTGHSFPTAPHPGCPSGAVTLPEMAQASPASQAISGFFVQSQYHGNDHAS